MFELIGKVESTFLGIEDHGILTATVYFNFGGTAQGIEAIVLHVPGKPVDHAGSFIVGLLQAFGVNNWNEVKGRTVWVQKEDEWGFITGIRPLEPEPGTPFVIKEWQDRVTKEDLDRKLP